MNTRNWTLAGLSAVAASSLAFYEIVPAFGQQGTPAQGGQPAQAPRPANPEPNPSTPQPRAVAPQVSPTQTSSPTPGAPAAAPTGRYQRPFAFQSGLVESHFNESTRQLAGLEQRMTRSNQDLLKRLGEVRTLPVDKQNAAMVDLLQQMLMDQAQMQKYLIQARTAWSGQIDLPAGNEAAPSADVPAAGSPQATTR